MTEALAHPASFDPLHDFPTLQAPLRSGWSAFDDLGLVRPGRVVLFDVAPDAEAGAARFFADLLASAGACAVLVEAPGAEPLPAVRAPVRVARPRTRGALLSLLEGPLPELLASEPAGLVVVAGLPEACLAGRRRGGPEGRAWLSYALGRLRETARAHGVAVALPTSVLARHASHGVRRAVEEGADEAVALLPAARGALRFRVPARGVLVQASPGRPASLAAPEATLLARA